LNEQLNVSGTDRRSLAVVAWLDYSPPGEADVYGVAHDYLAEAGSDRLAAALDGLHANRMTSGVPAEVSVVGHSYGTNVATLALTKSRADHLVMLGSAGVSNTIATARDLNVPAGEVFATQGHHDAWATTGQTISGRQDPTAPSFAAHDFSSEKGTDEHGRALDEVTQHGPFAPPAGADKYSYLDSNTTAMHNTAKATTSRGAQIPIGGTPSDRLGLQLQDRVEDLMRKGGPWAPQT
jgi:pimeloyl-ACP methyl ester carboxylesterase